MTHESAPSNNSDKKTKSGKNKQFSETDFSAVSPADALTQHVGYLVERPADSNNKDDQPTFSPVLAVMRTPESQKESTPKADADSERDDDAAETALSMLTPEESQELTRQLVAERRAILAQAPEAPLEPAEAAANEADDAFLMRVAQELATAPPAPAIETAFTATTGTSPTTEELPSAPSTLVVETEPAVIPVTELSAGEIPLTAEPIQQPGYDTRPLPNDILRAGAGDIDNGGNFAPAAPGNLPPAAGEASGGWLANRAPRPVTAEQPVIVDGIAAGLFVGYLIGRRRGRLRAEHRMEPVKRRLEQQVQALQTQLLGREAQVRRLARENYVIAQTPGVELPAMRAVEARPAANAQPKSVEGVGSVRAIEHLPAEAHALTAEAVVAAAKVEQLPLPAVLEMSEVITVGSTPVRKIFESNLISERGLRHIVEANIRGEDVRRVLTEELMVKEMDHERDPRLRDRPVSVTSSAGANQSLAGAPAVGSSTSQPVAPIPATSSALATPATASRPAPAILVAANIAALTVLAVVLGVFIVVWLMR